MLYYAAYDKNVFLLGEAAASYQIGHHKHYVVADLDKHGLVSTYILEADKLARYGNFVGPLPFLIFNQPTPIMEDSLLDPAHIRQYLAQAMDAANLSHWKNIGHHGILQADRK